MHSNARSGVSCFHRRQWFSNWTLVRKPQHGVQRNTDLSGSQQVAGSQKPAGGSIIVKRAKTNHEYTFLRSEPQIFTDVLKTKVGSIFFGFWIFVLDARITL